MDDDRPAGPPPGADLSADFLMRLGPLLARLENETLATLRPRLTYRQYRVLERIEEGHRSPTQLARVSLLSLPSLSESIVGLVQRGLLRREPNPEDGRSVLLRLTSQGQRALDAAHHATQSLGLRVVAELSVAQRRELEAILTMIHQSARHQFRRQPPNT